MMGILGLKNQGHTNRLLNHNLNPGLCGLKQNVNYWKALSILLTFVNAKTKTKTKNKTYPLVVGIAKDHWNSGKFLASS